MSITRELTSGGFAWDRKQKEPGAPCWLVVKKRNRARAYAKGYDVPYKQAQREKWLTMGVIQPRTAADMAFMAKRTG